MIKFNFLNSFSLLELWLVLWFIFFLLLCIKLNLCIFPILVVLLPPLRFITLFLIAIITTLLVTDTNKTRNLLNIMEYSYQGYIDVKVIDDCKVYENSIIISNYPATFVEYTFLPLYLTALNKKYKIVVGHGARNFSRALFDSDKLLILEKDNNYETLNSQIKECMVNDIIPIVYPEISFWTRENKNTINKFRTGIFKICKENKIKIIPTVTTHIEHMYGLFVKRDLRVTIMREQSYGVDADLLREEMQQKLNETF